MAKRFIGVLLAVLLLLTACTSSAPVAPTPTPASVTAAPTQTPVETPAPTPSVPSRRTIPFSQMAYTRPSSERFLREANACMLDFYDCNSAEEQAAVYERFCTLADDLATMQTIAFIRSNMDHYDEYWAEENTYCSGLTHALNTAVVSVCDILQKSRFRSELETMIDPSVFMRDADTAMEDNEELQAIAAHGAGLVSDYTQLLATLTVSHEGEELSLAQATAMNDGREAQTAWLKQNSEILGQYYCEIVKNRKKRAALNGYDSYAKYIYDQKGRDYTPEMAAALREDVKTYVAPLYKRLLNDGAFLDPRLTVSLYDSLAFLHDTLPLLSPRFAEPFAHMIEYELYDLAPRAGKRSGGFTSYLCSYDAPFLLMSFTEDSGSLLTLFHEFGHFCDFYEDDERLERCITDVTETFSQGLEFLMLPYLDRLFPSKDQQALERYTLLKAINVYVYQSYWDEFQEEVYALEEDSITVKNINDIAEKLCKAYGVTFGSRYINERYWVTLTHNYETPFYTLSYVTSADAALQLYLISAENQSAATDTYFKLFDRQVSEDLIANMEAAGLISPFAQGHAQQLADALSARADTLLAALEAAETPAEDAAA